MKIKTAGIVSLLAAAVISGQLFAAVSYDGVSGTGKTSVPASKIALPEAKGTAVEITDKGMVKDFYTWLSSHLMKKGPKKWTVMIFVNSKNNLDPAGVFNVNQMEEVGSDSNINIVVEQGRIASNAEGANASWQGSRRYLIKKDKDEDNITSPALETASNVDMGDYNRVVDFVQWSKKNFPAQKYALIIWNHGSGFMDPIQDKGISFDDETKNFIRTTQLPLILKAVGGVDLYASDACLMQMMEVAYEIKDYAKVVVGSEEVVPGLGYHYAGFLGLLEKDPNATPETLGIYMTMAFKALYDQVKQPACLSALRPDQLPSLSAKLDAFSKAVMTAAGYSEDGKPVAPNAEFIAMLKSVRAQTLRFQEFGSDPKMMALSTYTDMFDFVWLVVNNTEDSNVKTAGQAVLDFFPSVVYSNVYSDDKLANAHGLSINVPRKAANIDQSVLEDKYFENKYSDLKFAQESAWPVFFDWMASATK